MGKFQLDEAGFDFLIGDIGDAMAPGLKRLSDMARSKAPVRKAKYKQGRTRVELTVTRHDEGRSQVKASSLKTRKLDFFPQATHFTIQFGLPKGSRASASAVRALSRRFGHQIERDVNSSRRLTFRFGNRNERGGYLRSHIHPGETRQEGNRIIGTVVSDAPYSMPQEMGFHHHPDGGLVKGQPFMRPALEEFREEIESGRFLKG